MKTPHGSDTTPGRVLAASMTRRTGPQLVHSAQPFTLLVRIRNRLVEVELPAVGRKTLGRGQEADIILEDDSISRTHARFHGGPEPMLEDLGSTNGTRVMGRIVERGVLSPLMAGSVVQLGDVVGLIQRSSSSGPDALTPSSSASFAMAPGSREVVLNDPAMLKAYQFLNVIAPSALPVLILGETGVGKDVYAESIHRRSDRGKAPYLRLNCAALPETILEGELFGYERGAFTGAVQAKAGLFESADGGTVFLDEIGELPLTTQAKLLRVLENGEVMRLGALKPKRVDIRIVSATNRDLEGLAAQGRFRADLYFRLNGVSVTIPSLRERPLDVEALASHFVDLACTKLNRRSMRLSRSAVERLIAYSWPGNIRELRNVVDRAVLLSQSDTLEAPDFALAQGALASAADALSRSPPAPESLPALPVSKVSGDFHSEVKRLERQRIFEALERCGGNQSQAAKLIGIPRRTFLKRLDEYNIVRPRKGQSLDEG